MFRYEILTATAVKLMSDVLQFSSPFLLNELIGFVSDANSPLWLGIVYALAMFACSELRSFLINYYFFLMFRAGIKIQTTLTAAVYKKTLKLSNAARRSKTVGEIVNLMAIDVERFQLITPQIQQFWSCPFQITLALIYLFYTLGASATCGVVVMLLFLPFNIFSSIIVKRWQMEQMKLKDERAKMCNEILNGIKVIKLYAWEPPMEETVERIRARELALVRKAGFVRAVVDAFNTASPFIVALLTFMTYTLSSPSHILTPQIAFVSLTLFNQLRSPMTMIAFLIQQTVQAVVANKRLKEFFVADELDPLTIDRSPASEDEANSVEIKNATCVWEAKANVKVETNAAITDINMEIPRGNLIAVVGKVGCGKSTLLNALLGEMEKLRGYIGVRGQMAYVPQQPWIQNLTLRENIIFGKKYDEKFYDRVIEACALRPDIAILPQGDSTEIGEKGINLSGGQKARVSLARAVYQNYDVYLLDDPLSAVDSHVGKHIFKKVIGPNGLLKHKTRILVTHGLTYLTKADAIVVMHDGKIVDTGKFAYLMGNCKEFAEFMEECRVENEKKEKEEVKTRKGTLDEERTDVVYADFEATDDFDDEHMTTEFQRQMSTISALANEATRRRSRVRTISQTSNASMRGITKKDDKIVMNGKGSKSAQLIEKERAETGRVKLSVYLQYIRSATFLMSMLTVVLFASFSGFQLGRGLWLSQWSDANGEEAADPNQVPLGTRLGVYAALGFTESISFFASQVFLVIGGLNASRHLHTPLLHNLMRSPMSFFDTTPIGRILNRFGKDIDVIDQLLPINFRYFIMCILNVLSTLIVIVVSTPIFAAVIVPLAGIYYASLRFYVPTSRQMKRLEGIHRSPIYSHFGESIQGASSIRAFGKVNEFYKISEKLVDTFIRCKYLNLVSNRWLAVRLEFVGNCVVLFAALFAVLSREWGVGITAGVVGLSVSYALNITETLNFAVRQVSELETNIVAVERVKEYAETPTEAEWRIDGVTIPKGWPKNGAIELHEYSTRYREGLDFVVRKLNASIQSAEKIGIVGRTGAGKSSLALALFRMIEAAEGEILIDNTNIATIGLHDLRSNLTIIPQDPVLFSGSLRFNLDPFRLYDDHEIWTALELAHLKSFASGLADGLNHIISEGGENISVGQRQLVCLARALLRKSKVLILDEATAAVDLSTDALIQETIRREFKSSTVLTIAHRLNTILDYDRILVLDKGRICEFDTPQRLLANRYSAFYAMAKDAQIVA
uniref:Multidrug resistance-associated protein 1 n=1 Tax=Ascaris suum TaxID=6253 RepID=F1KS39_ASCSU